MNACEQLQKAMSRMPPRVGGKLCLDFMNTIEPRGGPSIFLQLSEQQRASQHEYFAGYCDFLAWSVLAGVVREEDACQLQEQAMLLESQAEEALREIIVLRERLYALFWSVASSQEAREQELEWLHQSYLEVLPHARLTKTEGLYRWQWSLEREHLTSPTWPLVQSALELLTTGDLTRIKICPGTPESSLACAWLFYDGSKNRNRHWCSMADCGSKTKARRQTVRRRLKRMN
jgi:predicted RNA-binding Zn ribbon-like protein